MRIQRFIGELCIFKNRASSSENESRAAQHIYQLMRSIGLIAGINSFKSQKHITWEILTILFFFLIEIFLYFKLPIAALIVGITGIIFFIGYFTLLFKPLARLFRHSTSNNVVGRLINPNAPYKVIFTAHYDSARSGPLWNPDRVSGFRQNFIIGAISIILLQGLVILKLFAIENLIFISLAIFIGLMILVQATILIYSRYKGVLVEGASDNASGVSVLLDLASRLKDETSQNIEFWFVATGSEEVGAIGMLDFMKSFKDDIDKNTTYFINIDNVGSGNLHYFKSEGMLKQFKFSKDLITAAHKSAQKKEFKDVTPKKFKLAYTDALIPASRGYHSILLLAQDDHGQIPNWHWQTDTLDNIDFSLVQKTSDFAYTMIKNLSTLISKRIKNTEEEMTKFHKELVDSDLEY